MRMILDLIERDIRSQINADLDRLGVLYRLFSRVKEPSSMYEKIDRKGYSVNGKKMQDIIGFRIVTYFYDDVKLLFDFFRKRFKEVDFEFDVPKSNIFEPLRKNLVCRFENDNAVKFSDLLLADNSYSLVDSTYEIQFRTTFSEGWHEVEHNMRYKCKDEWSDLLGEWRTLNGMYAVMETSDQALKGLFEDISYYHYRNKNWVGMLRNKFRLRFKLEDLKSEIVLAFDSYPDLAKAIFKCDRQTILRAYIDSDMRMQMSMNNLVFLINHLHLKNEVLYSFTPQILKEDFTTYFINA